MKLSIFWCLSYISSFFNVLAKREKKRALVLVSMPAFRASIGISSGSVVFPLFCCFKAILICYLMGISHLISRSFSAGSISGWDLLGVTCLNVLWNIVPIFPFVSFPLWLVSLLYSSRVPVVFQNFFIKA